jgi:hypothetical protein
LRVIFSLRCSFHAPQIVYEFYGNCSKQINDFIPIIICNDW